MTPAAFWMYREIKQVHHLVSWALQHIYSSCALYMVAIPGFISHRNAWVEIVYITCHQPRNLTTRDTRGIHESRVVSVESGASWGFDYKLSLNSD